MTTRRLRISGRVQGVGFRESMRQEAQRLGVAGWVRNRMDGSVEAVVQGSADQVDAIVAWARRGPEQACVERMEVDGGADAEALKGFDTRPTA